MFENEENTMEENLTVEDDVTSSNKVKTEWNIGDVVNEEEYTNAAIYCNETGDRHIELMDDAVYRIMVNPVLEPTKEEIVAKMEAETGLTRVMREIVLAENSGASEYVKAKAQEIEDLATTLRKEE